MKRLATMLGLSIVFSLPELASASLFVEIQPIQVRNDDGSNPALVTLPEAGLDAIYAQAGIDIRFLPTTTLDSTEFRDLEYSEATALFLGANGQHADPLVLNLWFTGLAGQPPPIPPSVIGAGQAFINRNGAWVHGPGLAFASELFSSLLIGHMIGHNLGVEHPTAPIPGNLMNDPLVADLGEELTAGQIALMRTSRFVQGAPPGSVPAPSTILLLALGGAVVALRRG